MAPNINPPPQLAHHRYSGAVIPGVPNAHLATLLVLPLLAILPLRPKSREVKS
jgi:hypothetical protein